MTGRPRKFEEDKVLEAAMNVFWAKGFQGTSYADLADAMGMNRPSIYAAFGNKEELFLSAVECCVQSFALPAGRLLNTGKDVQTSFENYFIAMVKNAVIEGHPGCLITTVLGEASNFTPAFKERLKLSIESGDQIITDRLERAVQEGELEKSTDVKTLGKLINNFVMAFAVRARSGESEDGLILSAKKTVKYLFEK